MNESTVNNYYYGDESNQFSFFRIPRQLITGDRFKHISTDAKLLYGCNTHKSNKNRIVPEKICLYTKKKPEAAMRLPAFCV